MPEISVIISAYNNFDAFIRAFPFWLNQSCNNFELIIADDGSSQQEIDKFHVVAKNSPIAVKHLWHFDDGFNKCGMLNKAILAAQAPRLLFLDADMLPRYDLVESHIRLLKKRFFITGGSHVNVNKQGQLFLEHKGGVVLNEIFMSDTLLVNNFMDHRKVGRLGAFGLAARVKDFFTWRTNAFTGANSSCWKTDALAVNGFDASWGYGGLDRDFGIRLTNSGISSRRFQYSLVAIHQNHERPYRDKDVVRHNKQMLKTRMLQNTTWISNGIDKLAMEDVQCIWSTHNASN